MYKKFKEYLNYVYKDIKKAKNDEMEHLHCIYTSHYNLIYNNNYTAQESYIMSFNIITSFLEFRDVSNFKEFQNRNLALEYFIKVNNILKTIDEDICFKYKVDIEKYRSSFCIFTYINHLKTSERVNELLTNHLEKVKQLVERD
jgi:hypothetical protein